MYLTITLFHMDYMCYFWVSMWEHTCWFPPSLGRSTVMLKTADWQMVFPSQWAFSPWIIQTPVNNSASLCLLIWVGTWTVKLGGGGHRGLGSQGETGSRAAHQGPTYLTKEWTDSCWTCAAGHELIIQHHARIIFPLEVDVMQCVNRMFVSSCGIYTQPMP